jgi:hypothetical protein
VRHSRNQVISLSFASGHNNAGRDGLFLCELGVFAREKRISRQDAKTAKKISRRRVFLRPATLKLNTPGGCPFPLRREPDHFGEAELALLYIAKRLQEALRLEKLLTDAGFDYLVEPDRYRGGVIFQTERIGAFFYVQPSDEQAARDTMERGGFRPYRE